MAAAATLALLAAPSAAFAGTSEAAADPFADAALAQIRQETDRLMVQPRTVELTSEKARAAREALLHGDFAGAHRIFAEVLAASQLGTWHFAPFGKFMGTVTCTCEAALEARLNEWVGAAPGDPVPLTARAENELALAWLRRDAFQRYVELARADAEAAMRLDATNPYIALQLMRILSANGNSPAFQQAFKATAAKFPDYYEPYKWQLWLLSPRWGGSFKAMYGFADQTLANLPKTSPLQLLRLQLYSYLLDASSNACAQFRGDAEKRKQCVVGAMQRVTTPDLETGVETALQLYDGADRYGFSLALKDVLARMIATPGGEANAGAILQLAASASGGDNRMNREPSAHGDLVQDELTGDVWYRGRYYDNAEKKYQQALDDAATTLFPNEEARDVALAEIDDRLAMLYYATSQFAKVAAYTHAAVAYGGNPGNGYHHYECAAYYKLKLYRAGLDACTAQIDQGNTIGTRFWRGKLNQALGDTKAALSDYAAAADSGAAWVGSSVIEMSLIHFDRKDYEEALRVLNAYPDVYDENTQSKSNLSVNYNNRCFAYMKLGQLRKALDDCTASLRFGSLPEAFAKQQELVKLLKDKVLATPAADRPI